MPCSVVWRSGFKTNCVLGNIMSILIRQIASAFFLLVGLISSLSWYEWKDSPLWMLLVGILFTFLGVVGVVLTIIQSEEELDS